jgi:hypothetical protein
MLDVPVVLIAFNRPRQTARLVSAIAAAKPKQVFLIADGPRPGHPTDGEQCALVHAELERFDPSIVAGRDFAEQNMGVGRRVSTGLDWVFGQVDQAIILEDDCLPRASFFPFCRELLDRYQDDQRILMISGTNPFGGWPGEASYLLTHHPTHWGWATWRRAWRKYDFTMSSWFDPAARERLRQLLPDELSYRRRVALCDAVIGGRIDTWDCQWTLMQLLCSGLGIVPAVNLVSNIGFGNGATHTNNRFALGADLRAEDVSFPLFHPTAAKPDVDFDHRYLAWQAGRPLLSDVLDRAARHLDDREFSPALLLLTAARQAGLPGSPCHRARLQSCLSAALAGLGRGEGASGRETPRTVKERVSQEAA